MYIGAWPEYHVAKLVAALEQPPASGRTSEPGGSRASGASGEALTAVVDALQQASFCRRVDRAESPLQRRSRGAIGPEQLPAAIARQAKRRPSLPPIGPGGSAPQSPRARGASPARIPAARAQSQQRVVHLQPPAPRAPLPPSREASPRPPPGAVPPRPQCHAPERARAPRTPPRLPPMGVGAPQPVVPETGAEPGDAEARGALALPSTPPWRRRPPPEAPGWISGMRARLELARADFHPEGPPEPRQPAAVAAPAPTPAPIPPAELVPRAVLESAPWRAASGERTAARGTDPSPRRAASGERTTARGAAVSEPGPRPGPEAAPSAAPEAEPRPPASPPAAAFDAAAELEVGEADEALLAWAEDLEMEDLDDSGLGALLRAPP